ncbi:MAG: phosphate ABC transporter permease subunit PstC [Streptococcaceae bacterium]|jgi:phosphate transport system permease protein|nr:phosphate ABC transporter permease subunit PstC [Streptococcaceae bacterium]
MTVKEKSFRNWFTFSALMSTLALIVITFFLLVNGIPAMEKVGLFKMLTGTQWQPSNNQYGIFPMLVGSFYVTVGALVIGAPSGILGAIFLAYFCPKRLYALLKQLVILMAGIPSIVYGFFGLVVLVPLFQPLNGSGKGIMTASLLLGIMILPTIINISEDALRAVPQNYYEGSVALGASHERTVFSVMVPAAKSGVLASVILGLGRAIGETMAVIMVAGNQAVIPTSITSGVRTLTTNIVMEMGYATDLHRQMLIATAVVLFVVILLVNLAVTIFKSKEQRNG